MPTYDGRNRVVQIQYHDDSTETYTYGTPANGRQLDANLVIESTDRNGNLERCAYDLAGREVECITAANDPAISYATRCEYLHGTTRRSSCTVAGDRTDFEYDYRNRMIATTAHPNATTSLTRTVRYDAIQRVTSTSDWYGRRTFTVYDVNDYPIRTVQEMAPGVLGAPSQAELAGLPRDPEGGANAVYLITDRAFNSARDLESTTDPRGIVHTQSWDQQQRLARVTEAAGTPVEATTRFVYDAQGNIVEVQHPRHLAEAGDFLTRMSYTGRNLVASRTEAVGRAEQATESFTYHLDRRPETRVDFRGHSW